MSKNRELLFALAATLATQVLTSVTVFAPAVLAPAAAADIGIPATAVGAFTSIAYAVAAFSAPVGGAFVARAGGIRVSQACLLLAGAGMAVCGLAFPLAVVIGALLVGAGYGPVTPASAVVLIERTPDRIRNLVMSIRQTGVPIGGAVAGALIPWLILTFGWRAAVVAVALSCAALALLLQPARRRFDAPAGGKPGARPGVPALFKLVIDHPALLRVSIASCAYAAIQTSITSYLVVFLVDRAELSLVAAGAMLSGALFAGIVGRIGWGVVADWIGNARLVLAGIGITTAVCAIALIFVTPAWPAGAILALCILIGATTVGWNGVYVAEVARIAPDGQVALATGASLMFTYAGPMVGPFIFWAIVGSTGSYAAAFVTGAVWTLGAALLLLKRLPRGAA